MKLRKKLFLLLIINLTACSSGDDSITPVTNPDPIGNPSNGLILCENGFADIYPCNGYDLVARIPLSDLNASGGNDIWGWTDTTTNKEYAIIGLSNGVAFIDISDPVNPVFLGTLPTATSSSTWRDIKVYNNHAFIVGDNVGQHGMQVFDLTRLRNVENPPQNFSADTTFSGFGSAHNIAINEATGYAYIVGADRNSTYRGGPLFINIQNPTNPILEGGYGGGGYSHDAQVVIYNGPDTEHVGKEIYVGSNESQAVIVNVTDKNNPIGISTMAYSNLRYTHQAWFTEDHRYLIIGDELDESGFGFNTRTLIFDVQDMDNPVLHTTYSGLTKAIDHNGYTKGNEFFLSNYTAGVRILDISGIDSGTIIESGFFDTFPDNDGTTFNGVWSVYPYFQSGNIIISDANNGFFIIRKSN
ncbi:choice-of-anchor B family protein [Leptobacterium sp. I13]|uniref:choice-of-anchor B family protein n=1 Tax=Leptobacterium meishanense TaxID=3128904 RepID=UPI0030EF2775